MTRTRHHATTSRRRVILNLDRPSISLYRLSSAVIALTWFVLDTAIHFDLEVRPDLVMQLSSKAQWTANSLSGTLCMEVWRFEVLFRALDGPESFRDTGSHTPGRNPHTSFYDM